jgi:hypothetical protein
MGRWEASAGMSWKPIDFIYEQHAETGYPYAGCLAHVTRLECKGIFAVFSEF